MRVKWLFVLIGFGFASACSTAPSDDDTDEPLTPEQRIEALEAIADKAFNLTGADTDARRQELLDYLLSRPEIESAGENEDGSLWAILTDGRPFMVIANQDDSSPDDVPEVPPLPDPIVAGELPNEIPRNRVARFFYGGEKVLNHTVNGILASMVNARGYNVQYMGAGTLDELKKVQGDGIFYFRGHGGYGYTRSGVKVYAPMSHTPVTLANDIKYLADWHAERLAYQIHVTRGYLPSRVAPTRVTTYYGFTGKFVKDNMRFADHSLAWVAACLSANATHTFLQNFTGSNAGVAWGWFNTFMDGADNWAALFVFDRMLGLNHFEKESPDQRPFDYASVWKDLVGYSDQDVSYWELIYLPVPPATGGVLAPSIKFMDMNEETEQLILHGKFGSVPGTVTVGGTNIPNPVWDPDSIKVQLPLTGAGSAGEVLVTVDGHRSNPRVLSEWRITFTLSFVPGSGNLKWEGPIRARIRADVQQYRDSAGQQPKFRDVRVTLAKNSDGEIIASGQHTSGGSTTRWEGTAPLVSALQNPLALNPIFGFGEIDTENKLLKLALFVTATNGLQSVSNPGNVTAPLHVSWAWEDGPISATNPVPAMYLNLGPDYAIFGGTRKFPFNPSEELSWSHTLPIYVPGVNALKSGSK